MKTENITIKDIAKALNLSLSTVSRALKGSYKISEATQQRVKAYAEQHHYRPNLIARSLKNQNSRCIGVVLCTIPNSFYAEVISGIESVAYEKDYLVIITQSFESYEREVKNLENLTWRSIDGLMVSLSSETQETGHFRKLQEQELPIVFFDRVPNDMDGHKVITDNHGGAYDATVHLINSGYRRIAHITSSAHMSISRGRLAGYRQALADHELEEQPAYIKYCAHGGMLMDEVEVALNELLQLPEPPDAIFTASDRLTLNCFSQLRKRGLDIPGHIALAGFSNFSAPELMHPALTTVKQAAFEMGRSATSLLIRMIESKRPVTSFETITLPTTLCVRTSTAGEITV